MDKSELYAYFCELYEGKNKSGLRHTEEVWDKKADSFKKHIGDGSTNDYTTAKRIEKSLDILLAHGLLTEECEMIDIGCGPGLFVKAFAPYVKKVTACDISGEMLKIAKEVCLSEGLSNVDYLQMDFRSANLEEKKLMGAYDLVFSFMTPAVSTLEGLKKSIAMSRAYCMNGCSLGIKSLLDDCIIDALAPHPVKKRADENWFYSMFNLLWLMGYDPATEFYTVYYEEKTAVTEESVRWHMDKLKTEVPFTQEEYKGVYERILSLSRDGYFHNKTESRFVNVLWDVRVKHEGRMS